MKVKFSLQPVLDYRASRVEALEIELAQIVRARGEAEKALERLRAMEQELFAEIGRRQRGVLNLAALAAGRARLRRIQEDIHQQTQVVEHLRTQEAHKRAELVAAMQDEKILEKLKEREQARLDAELARMEGRERDEIYVTRHGRSTHNGLKPNGDEV